MIVIITLSLLLLGSIKMRSPLLIAFFFFLLLLCIPRPASADDSDYDFENTLALQGAAELETCHAQVRDLQPEWFDAVIEGDERVELDHEKRVELYEVHDQMQTCSAIASWYAETMFAEMEEVAPTVYALRQYEHGSSRHLAHEGNFEDLGAAWLHFRFATATYDSAQFAIMWELVNAE